MRDARHRPDRRRAVVDRRQSFARFEVGLRKVRPFELRIADGLRIRPRRVAVGDDIGRVAGFAVVGEHAGCADLARFLADRFAGELQGQRELIGHQFRARHRDVHLRRVGHRGGGRGLGQLEFKFEQTRVAVEAVKFGDVDREQVFRSDGHAEAVAEAAIVFEFPLLPAGGVVDQHEQSGSGLHRDLVLVQNLHLGQPVRLARNRDVGRPLVAEVQPFERVFRGRIGPRRDGARLCERRGRRQHRDGQREEHPHGTDSE